MNCILTRIQTADEMSSALQRVSNGSDECLEWDLILADYHLPAFSAPEALKVLKASGFDIPFIVMSGAVSDETAVAAMRAGAHDYVSKENLTRLVPAIEREMSEVRQRRQRRVVADALLASEKRFHRLVEAMPLGLLMADSRGRLLYTNGAVERLLGLREQDAPNENRTLTDILPYSAAAILSSLQGSSQTSTEHALSPFETEGITHDGSRLPLLVAAVVLDPEAPVEERRLAAFLVDMSDQRRSQEAIRRTEKLAATGRLAASIAHEINNPLEAVINCLYLLNQAGLSGAAMSYLETAQRELDRVVHITTQTLRFYRQNTRPAETDMVDLIESALGLFEPRIRTLGIEVIREFHPIPRIIVYDGEIRQILANLIGNAIDAMQSSGRKLTLKVYRGKDWKQNCDGVFVSVADTGVGMDRETATQAFEPFFSTKGATGTGLGLWVSREILLKHMGSIRVRSHISGTGPDAGNWTVFRMFLPLASRPSAFPQSNLVPASA
jgi:PAS domain S-box-containing protein